MLSAISSRRRFADLSEQEILALAISSEEDDASIYRTYAERLRPDYPASAAVFDGMAAEEDTHRRKLIDLHQVRFGQVIPLIRREHVAGFYARKPVWLNETLGLDAMRAEARASGAPTQKWRPAPKLACGFTGRSGRNWSGWPHRPGSRLAAPSSSAT